MEEISWNHSELAEVGYVLTDEQWEDFINLMASTAMRYFTEGQQA